MRPVAASTNFWKPLGGGGGGLVRRQAQEHPRLAQLGRRELVERAARQGAAQAAGVAARRARRRAEARAEQRAAARAALGVELGHRRWAQEAEGDE
jgi:hypothetical protein